MRTMFEDIVAHTRTRVEQKKMEKPLVRVIMEASCKFGEAHAFAFENALRRDRPALICEVKKASPSKGMLDRRFPYLRIAKEYEMAGATAISVLTEPKWFFGSDRYLSEIKAAVGIPVLRKDFTVDPYQIYEAKTLGADAILLICSILTPSQLEEYIAIARELGLSALVEAHNEQEIEKAVKCGATMIGVNNRNLSTMEVDIQHSIRLRDKVPGNILFISESGIGTVEDVKVLSQNNVDVFLVGECLMKAEDKGRLIRELKEGAISCENKNLWTY